MCTPEQSLINRETTAPPQFRSAVTTEMSEQDATPLSGGWQLATTSSADTEHDGGNGSHRLTSPSSAKMLPVHLSGSQRRSWVPTNGTAAGNAHLALSSKACKSRSVY